MQAEALDTFAKIDAVVNINIDFSLLMDRLCGRRVCKECGESYHVSTLNGAEACSRCGGALYQRKDDNPETVGKRLDVYKEQTAPLIEYYTQKGILLNFTAARLPPKSCSRKWPQSSTSWTDDNMIHVKSESEIDLMLGTLQDRSRYAGIRRF